jgi:thymidylate synthase
MNKLDLWYQSLLSLLVSEDQSFNKSDRTGTGTKSLFGIQFRHDMSDGFPLLTTKKMAFKTMVTELLWFLRGDTNIKFLVDNNCHIWDGDAYKAYSSYVQEEWENGAINELFEDGLIIEESNIAYRRLTQEEFINQIKTDDEFAKKWGDLGKIYGFQWRNWNGKTKDELYEDYLKKVQTK